MPNRPINQPAETNGCQAPAHTFCLSQQSVDRRSLLFLKISIPSIPLTIDRYGRTIALINLHGITLNEKPILEGYARVYKKYSKKPRQVFHSI